MFVGFSLFFCFIILFCRPLDLHASPTKRTTPLLLLPLQRALGAPWDLAWALMPYALLPQAPGWVRGWPAPGELRDAQGHSGGITASATPTPRPGLCLLQPSYLCPCHTSSNPHVHSVHPLPRLLLSPSLGPTFATTSLQPPPGHTSSLLSSPMSTFPETVLCGRGPPGALCPPLRFSTHPKLWPDSGPTRGLAPREEEHPDPTSEAGLKGAVAQAPRPTVPARTGATHKQLNMTLVKFLKVPTNSMRTSSPPPPVPKHPTKYNKIQ